MSRIAAAFIALSAVLLGGVPTGGKVAAQDQAKPPSAADRLQPGTAGSTFGYLHLDVVEQDLNLTATQCAALTKLENEYDKQDWHLSASQAVKGGTDAYAKKLSELDNLFAPRLIDLLDEKQVARIREISIQSYGAPSLFAPAIAATLHLSDDQKQELKTILGARNTAIKDSHITSMKDAENVVRPFDDKMLAVLSPVQRDEFKKMHGKAIDLHASTFVAKIGQLPASRSTLADESAAGRPYPALEQLKPGEPRSALRLLKKDVVVKDLALTDEQQKNIKEITDEFEKALAQLGSGHSEEQIQKNLLLLNTTAEKTLGVLNEQQRKRLRQIFVQVAGGFGVTSFPVPNELQLSAEQWERVRQWQHQWLLNSIAVPKETTDDAERRAKRKKLSQGLRKNFEESLTPEQHRQFEAMQGKKIDIGDLYPTEPEKNAKPKGSGPAPGGGTGTK